MGFVIREVYPTGGHTVCSSDGKPMFFRDERDAEKTASTMNLIKKDVTRLFVVVPNSY